jgi:mannose-1-phosphate guanylyltransferase / mannose-6-phosphate isomerase
MRRGQRPVALKRFVEKPYAMRAAEMVAAGTFLWNAGIFLFRAKDIIAAFETHAPDLMAPVGQSLAASKGDLGFCRLDPGAWGKVQDISLDYAVMGKGTEPVRCAL